MQKCYKLYILLEISRLVLGNLAPFIGFSYKIFPLLWASILGHPTHIHT